MTKISTEVDSLSRSISLDMSYRLITEERDNENDKNQCRIYRTNNIKFGFKLISQTTGEYEKYKPLRDALKVSDVNPEYFINSK